MIFRPPVGYFSEGFTVRHLFLNPRTDEKIGRVAVVTIKRGQLT